jgi:hypothetical protein
LRQLPGLALVLELELEPGLETEVVSAVVWAAVLAVAARLQ